MIKQRYPDVTCLFKWYKIEKQGGVMTRLIAIVFLLALAFVLFRYRTNEKVQKSVVIVIVSSFLLYTASLMFSELTR
jgi:uncharacterized membrane-anchored protein